MDRLPASRRGRRRKRCTQGDGGIKFRAEVVERSVMGITRYETSSQHDASSSSRDYKLGILDACLHLREAYSPHQKDDHGCSASSSDYGDEDAPYEKHQRYSLTVCQEIDGLDERTTSRHRHGRHKDLLGFLRYEWPTILGERPECGSPRYRSAKTQARHTHLCASPRSTASRSSSYRPWPKSAH